MDEYNASSLIKIMRNSLGVSQLVAGKLVLNPVASQDSVNVYVTDKMISNLVSRSTDVHTAIKEAASKPDIIPGMKTYINNKILKKYNNVAVAGLCQNLLVQAERDHSVPNSIRHKLENFNNEGNYEEFLTGAILCGLLKRNVLPDAEVNENDFYFLQEEANKCPLCGKPLVKKQRKKPVINAYRIVQIYPDDIDMDFAIEFSKIQPAPANSSSPDNMIALCLDCSKAYLMSPNTEDYHRLVGRKAELSKFYMAKQKVAQLEMETEIAEVVSAVAKLDVNTMLTPFTDPYSVDDKIKPEYFLLLSEIKDHVRQYYPYVESQFSQLDGSGDCTFNEICSEMTLAYEMLESAGLEQPEIFNQLAEKIVTDIQLGEKYKLAACIVVSFFVQLCSVFKVLDKEGIV